MAAPSAHHDQDSSTPFELQHPPVPPQAHWADRPFASSSTAEHEPPLPLSPKKLSRTRSHSSRRVFVASTGIGGQDTGNLVVLGEPVTMEELRWERAKFIKRRARRWKTVKECLGLVILSWTTYQTVRYFVAYKAHHEDIIRTRFAFALGLLSGLGTSLLIIYKVLDYLLRDHVLVKRILSLIVYLSSICIFAIALVNVILVPVWRYGTPSDPFSIAHSLQGRCKWDIDIIWAVTNDRCHQHPVPYGAFVAAAVIRTVMTAGFLIAFHLVRRRHAIAARMQRSYSATRLMGGKAESALHPSTSRLSSAPTVDATSPNLAPAQRGRGSPSGTITALSPILSPASSNTSSHLPTPNVRSPLPAVPEMTEAEYIREPSPLEFGRRAILGGPRWPDDPSGIESPEPPTPGSEIPTPGATSFIDRGGYFGHQGRETPSDASGSVDDEATWQADFRGLMQSLAADGPGSSDLSELQQRVLAQLQAMGAPMNPGDPWNREVPIMGSVVRRMSTIESFGSREREHAPDGASDCGFVRTSSSPSPMETRSGNRGSRPPSRSGTAATGSTAASGSMGSRQNARAGMGDSREPRGDS